MKINGVNHTGVQKIDFLDESVWTRLEGHGFGKLNANAPRGFIFRGCSDMARALQHLANSSLYEVSFSGDTAYVRKRAKPLKVIKAEHVYVYPCAFCGKPVTKRKQAKPGIPVYCRPPAMCARDARQGGRTIVIERITRCLHQFKEQPREARQNDMIQELAQQIRRIGNGEYAKAVRSMVDIPIVREGVTEKSE